MEALMKIKIISIFFLLICLTLPNLHAGEYSCYHDECSGPLPYYYQSHWDDGYGIYRCSTRVKKYRKKRAKCVPIPYGYRVDNVFDDEVRSPWSRYVVTTEDGSIRDSILYDPQTARPFRVPPCDDDCD